MMRRGLLMAGLAALLPWRAGAQQAMPAGQLTRGYNIDQQGNLSWWWRLERPGQSPLLGNTPPPMTPQERASIEGEAARVRAAWQQRQGNGTGGNGTQGGNQLPHRYGGPNTTRPTWNQNPQDSRGYSAQDAARDAARSDAARRAEFQRLGIPFR